VLLVQHGAAVIVEEHIRGQWPLQLIAVRVPEDGLHALLFVVLAGLRLALCRVLAHGGFLLLRCLGLVLGPIYLLELVY
jgi:hypothetical protein